MSQFVQAPPEMYRVISLPLPADLQKVVIVRASDNTSFTVNTAGHVGLMIVDENGNPVLDANGKIQIEVRDEAFYNNLVPFTPA